jgi:hypothetical protein
VRKPDFVIVAGDREPSIEYLLENNDGSAVNLSGGGVTVLWVMRAPGAAVRTVSGTATIVGNGLDGHVRYDWTAGDATALVPHRYYGQWQVTFPGSLPQTFPAQDQAPLIVDVVERL